MSFKALLTLDLNHVTEQRRTLFYDYLEKKQWIKISKINTAWKCTFQEGAIYFNVIEACKQDVRNAAKYASVKSFDAAVHVGEDDIQQFQNNP